jgi:hypothetical protein
MVHQELNITEGIVGKENAQIKYEIAQGQVNPYKKIPFNLNKTRVVFTTTFIWFFCFVSGALIWGVMFDWLTIEESKELAAIVLTPIFGILGTCIGFYFAGSGD